MKKRSGGNIMDFITVGIAVIAIAIVVVASFQSMALMVKKLEVSQIARRYILIMETKGYLSEQDRGQLMVELSDMGLMNIDLTGTTLQPVPYGNTILLSIKGSVTGSAANEDVWSEGFGTKQYYIEEKRMSTAKN